MLAAIGMEAIWDGGPHGDVVLREPRMFSRPLGLSLVLPKLLFFETLGANGVKGAKHFVRIQNVVHSIDSAVIVEITDGDLEAAVISTTIRLDATFP
eukprot:2597740-Pyramimonas_sp.AAC.1